METRGALRRAAQQQQAAEELTQDWLQRQGPYAVAAMAQIQQNRIDIRNSETGHNESEPRLVARATDSTFAGLSPFHGASDTNIREGNQHANRQRSKSLLFSFDDNHLKRSVHPNSQASLSSSIEPVVRQRRMTRARARELQDHAVANLFQTVIELVFESRYLNWFEFIQLRAVNRSCLAFWYRKREVAGPWKEILKEINSWNGTNKCHRCEQVLLLQSHRSLCVHKMCDTIHRKTEDKNLGNGATTNSTSIDTNHQKKIAKQQNRVWDQECAKRKPDFVSCIDILMSNGVLSWRERGGIRRICKATYMVYKRYCTCKHPVDCSTSLPFVNIDPRYRTGYYDSWTDYERCEAMILYTLRLKNNLHAFYNFGKVTNPDSLPYGLARWDWFDIQMVTLQSNCPKRYALIMHIASLFIAQAELRRRPPVWYADAFVGKQHHPYTTSYVDSLATIISEHCLPATDEVICHFLRTRCYPSSDSQNLLGPLSKQLSIFSPFFDMVPLDKNQPTSLPKSLEILNEELIDSMSMNILCSMM